MSFEKSTLVDAIHAGPAVAARGDELLMGWAGAGDQRLNFARSGDGRTLSSDTTLSDTSPRALGLTVFNNRYVVAWIGGEKQYLNIMQSDDGMNWDSKVTLQESSPSEPTLTVFKGEMYLAWRAADDDRITIMRSADGKEWRDKRTLEERTCEGPTLATLGDVLLVGWVEARIGLDLFITGSDAKVRYKHRQGSTWEPAGDAWETLKSSVSGPVEAVASGAEVIDLLARGTDSHLYHKRWDGDHWLPGGVEGDWNYLAGTIVTTPAALSWAPDNLDMFMSGSDSKVWHRQFDASPLMMGGAGWEGLGGETTKNKVCAISTGLDRYILAFSADNGYIYHSWWDGSKWTTSWAWIGMPSGSLTNQPIQGFLTGPGRFTLLCRRVDGAVYLKHWSGTAWNPGGVEWWHIGWKMSEPPRGVAWGKLANSGDFGSKYCDFFARGDDGAVWFKRHVGNAWEPAGLDWVSLGGNVQGTICAVSSGDNSYDLFIRGVDNAVYHKSWDGSNWNPSQSGWNRIGGETSAPPSALGHLSNGRLCVARSTDGTEFKRKTFLPGTTRSRPWLHADATGGWIAWQKPEDYSIHLMSSADGSTWKETELGEAVTCHDSPALTSWKGRLVLCWAAAEGHHGLNVSSSVSSNLGPNPSTAPQPQPQSAPAQAAAVAGTAAAPTQAPSGTAASLQAGPTPEPTPQATTTTAPAPAPSPTPTIARAKWQPLSELNRKKLTRYFRVHDLDKGGFVDQPDFTMVVSRIARVRRWPADSPEYRKLDARYRRVWEEFWKPADSDGDGWVGLEEFLKHVVDSLPGPGPTAVEDLTRSFEDVFDALDMDHDGGVALEDYRYYYACSGQRLSDAGGNFAKLDLNGDGRISREEFTRLCTDFFLGDDPQAPGNWLFGPYEEDDAADLVVVVGSSLSLRNEVVALNRAAESALEGFAAKSSTDLRTTWLGIEGTISGTRFDHRVRRYLLNECGVPRNELRSRRRGQVPLSHSDSARSLEDLVRHFDWRYGARRAVLFLGDRGLDSGTNQVTPKTATAVDRVRDLAVQEKVTIHTYFGECDSMYRDKILSEYVRLARETGGLTMAAGDPDMQLPGFLEQVLNAKPGTISSPEALGAPSPAPSGEPAEHRPGEAAGAASLQPTSSAARVRAK